MARYDIFYSYWTLSCLVCLCIFSTKSCWGWTLHPGNIIGRASSPSVVRGSQHHYRKHNSIRSIRVFLSAESAEENNNMDSNDKDDSSTNTNNVNNNNNKKKKKRVKYDLGLQQNYPEYEDTSQILDRLVQNWCAPEPVSKPTEPSKSVPYDKGSSSSSPQPQQKESKKSRRTSYDVGMGKNPPKMPLIHTQALELGDDTEKSKVLRRALWHEEHYNGGTSEANLVGDDYDDTYSYAGSFEGGVDSSIPKPRYLYPDIELSVPSRFYSERVDAVWDLLRYEAQRECQKEPLLVSFLHSTILNHRSLESALAFHLANKLSSPAMISTQIQSLVMEALNKSPEFRRSLRADIMAVRDRDPACTCLPDVFLYFKGFHALQTHRVAHYMWKSNRRVLSHYLQSQMSQNFQIDIHPNATLGSGIMLDHGTGIVIGETARVGHNCSILHHVTLGGSGKKGVDRHPKVGDGVLLGAGCSILGNIHIGDGCQIGAGTLVTADLPAHSVAVGVPAKIIGSFVDVTVQPSIDMNQMAGSQEFDKNLATFESEGI